MKTSTAQFDFCEPIKKTTSFIQFNQGFTDTLESEKSEKPKYKSSGRRLNLVVICFLLASLIGISYFSYTQWKEKEFLIAQNQQAQVAGAQDEKVKNIVPGENFSLVMDLKTPEGFAVTKKVVDSNFFENKKGVLSSSFIARKVKDEKELVSGIQVLSSEYDFKLDQAGFANFVKEKLGEDWTILADDINLPGQVIVSKISKKDKTQTYFTTVTKIYYYIIQVLNDTKGISEFNEISQFSDQLLLNLHLN